MDEKIYQINVFCLVKHFNYLSLSWNGYYFWKISMELFIRFPEFVNIILWFIKLCYENLWGIRIKIIYEEHVNFYVSQLGSDIIFIPIDNTFHASLICYENPLSQIKSFSYENIR